jgi:hypothetical protein
MSTVARGAMLTRSARLWGSGLDIRVDQVPAHHLELGVVGEDEKRTQVQTSGTNDARFRTRQ